MQRELSRRDALTYADVLQQLARQMCAFTIEHLPAYYLAAEDVQEQVQIELLPPHLSREVGNVPTVDLVRGVSL